MSYIFYLSVVFCFIFNGRFLAFCLPLLFAFVFVLLGIYDKVFCLFLQNITDPPRGVGPSQWMPPEMTSTILPGFLSLNIQSSSHEPKWLIHSIWAKNVGCSTFIYRKESKQIWNKIFDSKLTSCRTLYGKQYALLIFIESIETSLLTDRRKSMRKILFNHGYHTAALKKQKMDPIHW